MKKNQKILKPIDLDLHFKYRCSNNNCENDHWLSLKESKTKNFKIVCECGSVYRPKKINKIRIVYDNKKTRNKPDKQPTTNKEQEDKIKIPVDLQAKCVKLLCGYGFTTDESILLVDRAFEISPTEDAGLLIKYIIQNLENLNVSN